MSKVIWSGSAVSGVPSDVYNQCKSIAETSKWDTKEGREEATTNIAKCSADAACAAYSGGAIPPGVCSTVAGPAIEAGIKIWNSIFGNDDEAEKARKRRREVAAYFSNYNHAIYFDETIDRLLSASAARLIEFSDRMRSEKGLLGGGTLYVDKEFCWPWDSGTYKCIEGPLPYRTHDRKAREALLAAGLPLVVRKEQWDGSQWVDNLFWFARLTEYAKMLADKKGLVSAANWMKQNAQKDFDDWQTKIAVAEMIVRAKIIGEAVADKKIAEKRRTRIAVGTAAVAVVGVGLAIWKPALFSALKRIVTK